MKDEIKLENKVRMIGDADSDPRASRLDDDCCSKTLVALVIIFGQ